MSSRGPGGVCGRVVDLEEMLAAREARAARLGAWSGQGFGCVVSATIVVPGPVKTPPWVADVFAEAVQAVRRTLASRRWSVQVEDVLAALPTGPEAVWLVQAPAREVKAALASLEDGHPVGRLWDLDVLIATTEPHPQGARAQPIARTEVGRRPRSCLLCSEPSAACARSRRHSIGELLALARELSGVWAVQAAGPYARLAHECLLAEVWHTPKPGLVDRRNTGAHEDMDLPMFEASAAAVTHGLSKCERIGRAAGQVGVPLPAKLPELQSAGLDAEARMLDATGGVNTHRGAIFSLGLVCSSAGWLDGAGRPVLVEDVCDLVAAAAPPLPEPLGACRKTPPPPCEPSVVPVPSHGSAAFAAYGMTGARGAAASGFALVREHALPAYRSTLSATGEESTALAAALLVLLAHNEDTNLAARRGRQGVLVVRERATALLAAGGATAPTFSDGIRAFDDDLIAAHLSPGGSADLLGVTRFLARLPDRARHAP